MALLESLGALGAGANDQPTIASKEEIDRRRKLAQMLMQQGGDTSPVQHWTQGAARVVQSILGGVEDYQASKAEKDAQAEGRKIGADWFGGGAQTAPAAPNVGSVATPPGNTPANAQPQVFLDTLKQGGLTNPNALAAVGATGYHESRWSPDKIAGSWSDPSESGKAGTSGGALSWRAERLDNLRRFAASQGEQGNGSLATQAKFFMQEDPSLVAKLNGAKSPEEAMQHMNNAWRFAGYNREGGEAAARLASAGAWAGKMAPAGAAQAPVQVASADPNFRPQGQQAPAPASAGAPPQQVAQAGPAPAMPQTGGASEPTLQQLLAARNNPAFDRAPAGTQALVNALIQKKVTQETKDPLTIEKTRSEIDKLKLDAEKTRRELGRKEVDRVQGPDGQIYERPAGTDGEWKPTLKLNDKPEANTTDQRELEQINRERASQNLPSLRMDEWKLQKGKASAPAVNIDQKQESEFGKETGKALAKRFDQLATDGDEASQNQVLVDEMRRLGGKVQTGSSAAFKKRLGDIGIKLDGVSDIEAYSALLDRMTPAQRLPGSGATSDFDAKMFKGSLPSLMNTPGGNSLIIDTMEKLNANKVARGDIAMRVQVGELKPNEGLQEIRKLQAEARALSDAVKDFGKPKTTTQPGAAPPQADGWQDFGGGVRIREKGAR